MEALNRRGVALTLDQLKHVVATSDKKRFAFSDDGSQIRANQGHSVEVDLQYPPETPPEILLLPKWKTQAIRWKADKTKILEAWFAEVDKNDDADLFRRLYEWKLSESFDWRKRDARGQQIMSDVRARFQAAATPAQRQTVLRKFDLW